MERQAVSLLTVFLLSDACSPSENSVQTAIAQTQAAIPMVTLSGAINLAEIYLNPVLFQAEIYQTNIKAGKYHIAGREIYRNHILQIMLLSKKWVGV